MTTATGTYSQMLETLRTGPCTVRGMYSTDDVRQMRQYLRVVEARLKHPLSCTWTGTLDLTGDTEQGRATARHGVQVFIDRAIAG